MVTLAFEHESPGVAVDVLESLQLKINSQMRDSVIEDSKRNIEYLTVEANNTSVADLKAVFYRLIEEQTKTLMLASSSREFVFKKATPILMPVSPSGPPRLLITIIMGLMTFLLGCLVAVIVGPRNAAE
jgi:LPS O-antigen subunit length determinant protein (WzzB/FepE family)